MVTIALATLDDLRRLTELEAELFESDRISCRQFKYLLTKANSFVIKAEHEGELLGYMVLLRRKTTRRLRIYSIGVSKAARNQGVAGSLLIYAEGLATFHHSTQLTLEVCEKNQPAVKLYTDFGFLISGKKTNYYEDGCTALLLRKNLCQ